MIVPKYFEDFDHPACEYHAELCLLHSGIPPYGGSWWRNREASDRFFPASGDWKFPLFTSVYDVKEEFSQKDTTLPAFETDSGAVRLAGIMAMTTISIRTSATRSRVDPAYVPYENPCGAYVRTSE